MTNSTRYNIAQAVYALAQTVAGANQAEALFNPKFPIDTKDRAARLLFVMDRGDRLVANEGQREKRRARVVLGALIVTEGDTPNDGATDALHFAARAAIKADSFRALLASMNAPVLRETDVEPELKEVALEGGLLLSAFEIEFLETYPAA